MTGCGSFWVALEKKAAILSLNDGLLDGTAGEAGDDAAAAGGLADAVVEGPPNPPPLQPAISNANTSSAAVGARLYQPIPRISRNFSRVIANFASPDQYSTNRGLPKAPPAPPVKARPIAT